MRKVMLMLMLTYFMLFGLTGAFANTGQKEKNLKAGEIFAFNVDERLIYVSVKKAENVETAHCGTVVVIAEGKPVSTMIISGNAMKLPSNLKMPNVTLVCESSNGVTVIW